MEYPFDCQHLNIEVKARSVGNWANRKTMGFFDPSIKSQASDRGLVKLGHPIIRKSHKVEDGVDWAGEWETIMALADVKKDGSKLGWHSQNFQSYLMAEFAQNRLITNIRA